MRVDQAALLRRLQLLQKRATVLYQAPAIQIVRYDANWRLVDRHSAAIEATIPAIVEALITASRQGNRKPPEPITVYVGPLGDICPALEPSWQYRQQGHYEPGPDFYIVSRLVLENDLETKLPPPYHQLDFAETIPLLFQMLAFSSQTNAERVYWEQCSQEWQGKRPASEKPGYWQGRFADCPDRYAHLRTPPCS